MEKAVIDMANTMLQQDDKTTANDRYCLFYPMVGKDYNEKKELLMYGQYVDDWKPTFKLTKDKKLAEGIVKKAFDYSTVSRGCALDWVNKYWIKQSLFRSFFWNISCKLSMERYGRTNKDWNHIIAYSNLVKIHPVGDINNSHQILHAQQINAAHLFKEELSLLQPKNVILITGLQNWAEPVLRSAGIKFRKEDGQYVEATAAYRGSHIIVAKKPFAADHRKFLDELKRNMV